MKNFIIKHGIQFLIVAFLIGSLFTGDMMMMYVSATLAYLSCILALGLGIPAIISFNLLGTDTQDEILKSYYDEWSNLNVSLRIISVIGFIKFGFPFLSSLIIITTMLSLWVYNNAKNKI